MPVAQQLVIYAAIAVGAGLISYVWMGLALGALLAKVGARGGLAWVPVLRWMEAARAARMAVAPVVVARAVAMAGWIAAVTAVVVAVAADPDMPPLVRPLLLGGLTVGLLGTLVGWALWIYGAGTIEMRLRAPGTFTWLAAVAPPIWASVLGWGNYGRMLRPAGMRADAAAPAAPAVSPVAPGVPAEPMGDAAVASLADDVRAHWSAMGDQAGWQGTTASAASAPSAVPMPLSVASETTGDDLPRDPFGARPSEPSPAPAPAFDDVPESHVASDAAWAWAREASQPAARSVSPSSVSPVAPSPVVASPEATSPSVPSPAPITAPVPNAEPVVQPVAEPVAEPAPAPAAASSVSPVTAASATDSETVTPYRGPVSPYLKPATPTVPAVPEAPDETRAIPVTAHILDVPWAAALTPESAPPLSGAVPLASDAPESAPTPTPTLAPAPAPEPTPEREPAPQPVVSTPPAAAPSAPVPSTPAAPAAVIAPVPEVATQPTVQSAAQPDPRVTAPAVAAIASAGQDDDDHTVFVKRRREAWVLETADGARYVLEPGTIVIGRATANPVTGRLGVADSTRTMSKLHAELTFANDAWSIRDLGSTNGTFVRADGQEHEVSTETARVVDGDLVLGELLARIVVEQV
ncbi:FHA domain-containing protein [Demequina sp.]|uniref:FHA domain-containing protein n=1 Tax=Demequina sp. TaxID=2050685 RepID=UPI003A86DA66